MNDLDIPAGICLTCGACFYPPRGCYCMQRETCELAVDIPVDQELREELRTRFLKKTSDEYSCLRAENERLKEMLQETIERVDCVPEELLKKIEKALETSDEK